jgi:hypothetical protein
LFDYLSTEGYKICYHEKFKMIVIDKIEEFYTTSPEIFTLFNPQTKEFLYAISGIKC